MTRKKSLGKALAKKNNGIKNLKPWKPGQTGNPEGRPPLPPEVKEARRFNKTTLEEIVNKYLWMSLDGLRKSLADEQLPAVEGWMVSIITKGRTTGEWSGFEWIAQRLVGKVKEQVEVSMVKPYIVHRADGTALELGAKVEKDED